LKRVLFISFDVEVAQRLGNQLELPEENEYLIADDSLLGLVGGQYLKELALDFSQQLKQIYVFHPLKPDARHLLNLLAATPD